MMIDLYTWATPNGRKVSIALEEFGLDYRVHPVDIGKDQQFAEAFLQLAPNNKIPVIVDGDVTLMESGAILYYLAERYGAFFGEDKWQTMQWLMLQMGGVGPMLGQLHHFAKFNPGKSPYAQSRFHSEALRLYGVLNRRLQDQDYLAGSYSIADIATWPWIARYEWHDVDWSEYPALLDWYLRIADRPAVRRGFDVPAIGAEIPIPGSSGAV
jgi:GST-like protein